MNTAAGFKPLARAVIVQAVKDMQQGQDPIKALDACLWMLGPDAPLWLDGLGLGDVDALAFVTGGRVRHLGIRLRRRLE